MPSQYRRLPDADSDEEDASVAMTVGEEPEEQIARLEAQLAQARKKAAAAGKAKVSWNVTLPHEYYF